MAIARHHLGRDVLRREPERLHHPCLDRGRDDAYVPTAPESLPTAQLLECIGEAVQVAVGLEGEAREPQAEGGRLGVDAVGAPDAERVARSFARSTSASRYAAPPQR